MEFALGTIFGVALSYVYTRLILHIYRITVEFPETQEKEEDPKQIPIVPTVSIHKKRFIPKNGGK